VNDGVDEIAQRVGEDMALAALNLFSGVIAPRAAGFRGLDGEAEQRAGKRGVWDCSASTRTGRK